MSKIGVSVKIDVSKIEKQRLYKGAKGTYLDATVFIDLGDADQYGNHGMITQDVSKDERQAGTKGPILGNVKIFYRDEQAPVQSHDNQAPQGGGDPFNDEIPFSPMIAI